jgi:hypothetical protein
MSVIVTISRRGNGRYLARVDGLELLVSRTPFLVAARKLLEFGYSPNDMIVMRHSGSEVDCLTSTIGAAARLRVSEPDDGKQSPTFRAWRPYGEGGGYQRLRQMSGPLHPPALDGQNAPATSSYCALRRSPLT